MASLKKRRRGKNRRSARKNSVRKNKWPLVLVAATGSAWALPTGFDLRSGTVDSPVTTGSGMTVTQTADKAIIHWSGFDIANGERVDFQLPATTSISLNRVTGGAQSAIDGALSSNGRLFLINPNGILFGSTASVDVNGLVATTSDMDDADFLAGNYLFDIPSATANVSVINQGTITTPDGGVVALVAPFVSNEGIVTARLGKVAIGSGHSFTLDFAGDGLISFATPASAPADDDATRLTHSGEIRADGGQVYLTVHDAGQVITNAINMTGIVEAKTISNQRGTIILGGLGTGSVALSGAAELNVRAESGQGAAGTVTIEGETVSIADTTAIEASGDTSGGVVKIGGPGTPLYQQATATTIGSGATITASAETAGDGGSVEIFGSNSVNLQGTVTARGIGASAQGGTLTVSGDTALDSAVTVDLDSPDGTPGTAAFESNITGAGPLDITGNAAFSGDIGSDGARLVRLNIGGTTTFDGTASQSIHVDTATFNGETRLHTNDVSIGVNAGDIAFNGKVTVQEAVSTLFVDTTGDVGTGTVAFAGDIAGLGSLDVTGDTTFSGDIGSDDSNGGTRFGNLTVNGTPTFNGTGQSAYVGTATFNGNVSGSSLGLSATGAVAFNGATTDLGSAYFSGTVSGQTDLTITGDATFGQGAGSEDTPLNTLTVNGNTATGGSVFAAGDISLQALAVNADGAGDVRIRSSVGAIAIEGNLSGDGDDTLTLTAFAGITLASATSAGDNPSERLGAIAFASRLTVRGDVEAVDSLSFQETSVDFSSNTPITFQTANIALDGNVTGISPGALVLDGAAALNANISFGSEAAPEGSLEFTGITTVTGELTATADTITFGGQLLDTAQTGTDALTLNVGPASAHFDAGIGAPGNPFDQLTVNSGPAYLTGNLYVEENADFPQGLVLQSAAGETVSLTSNTGEIHVDDGLTVENAVHMRVDTAGGAYLLNGIGTSDSPLGSLEIAGPGYLSGDVYLTGSEPPEPAAEFGSARVTDTDPNTYYSLHLMGDTAIYADAGSRILFHGDVLNGMTNDHADLMARSWLTSTGTSTGEAMAEDDGNIPKLGGVTFSGNVAGVDNRLGDLTAGAVSTTFDGTGQLAHVTNATFGGDVTGTGLAGAGRLDISGTATFPGDIASNTEPLGSLTVGDATTFNGVTDQLVHAETTIFGGSVTVQETNAALIVNTTSGADTGVVTFTGDIAGPGSLSITGNTTFEQGAGTSTPLASLVVEEGETTTRGNLVAGDISLQGTDVDFSISNSITFQAPNIALYGDVTTIESHPTLEDILTFTGTTTIIGELTATAETITFAGPLLDTTSGTNSLTLHVGSSSAHFEAEIGDPDNIFDSLTVNGVSNFNGGTNQSVYVGTATFNGETQLHTDVAIDAGSSVTFNGDVTGHKDYSTDQERASLNITVSDQNGTVAFNRGLNTEFGLMTEYADDLGLTGTTEDPETTEAQRLSNVTVTADTISLGGDVYTAGDITLQGETQVNLLSDNDRAVIYSGGNDITLDSVSEFIRGELWLLAGADPGSDTGGSITADLPLFSRARLSGSGGELTGTNFPLGQGMAAASNTFYLYPETNDGFTFNEILITHRPVDQFPVGWSTSELLRRDGEPEPMPESPVVVYTEHRPRFYTFVNDVLMKLIEEKNKLQVSIEDEIPKPIKKGDLSTEKWPEWKSNSIPNNKNGIYEFAVDGQDNRSIHVLAIMAGSYKYTKDVIKIEKKPGLQKGDKEKIPKKDSVPGWRRLNMTPDLEGLRKFLTFIRGGAKKGKVAINEQSGEIDPSLPRTPRVGEEQKASLSSGKPDYPTRQDVLGALYKAGRYARTKPVVILHGGHGILHRGDSYWATSETWHPEHPDAKNKSKKMPIHIKEIQEAIALGFEESNSNGKNDRPEGDASNDKNSSDVFIVSNSCFAGQFGSREKFARKLSSKNSQQINIHFLPATEKLTEAMPPYFMNGWKKFFQRFVDKTYDWREEPYRPELEFRMLSPVMNQMYLDRVRFYGGWNFWNQRVPAPKPPTPLPLPSEDQKEKKP